VQQLDAGILKHTVHPEMISPASGPCSPSPAIVIAHDGERLRTGRRAPEHACVLAGVRRVEAVRDEIAGKAHDVRPLRHTRRDGVGDHLQRNDSRRVQIGKV